MARVVKKICRGTIYRAPTFGFFLFLLFASLYISHSDLVAAQTISETFPVSISSSGDLGDAWSDSPALSADGRFIVFRSAAENLVTDDSNGQADIFIHDRLTGTTQRIPAPLNSIIYDPRISANGRAVIYRVEDAQGWIQAYIYDRLMGQTELVSVSTTGERANQWVESPSIAADGRYVAFTTLADNLIYGDRNNATDAIIHDRVTGYNYPTSVTAAGEQPEGSSRQAVLAENGREIAYATKASNSSGQGDPFERIVVYNRVLAQATVVSLPTGPGDTLLNFELSANANLLAYGLCLRESEQDTIRFIVRDLQSKKQREFGDYALPAGTCLEVPIGLALSGDGDFLAISYPAEPGNFQLLRFDLSTGAEQRIDQGQLGIGLDISTDGQAISYVKEWNGVDQIIVWNQRVEFPPAYVLSGQVTDSTGYPFSLVTLEMGSGETVRTDGNGFFWFGGINPGPGTLIPSKEGFDFEPGAISVDLQSDTKDISFTYTHDEVLAEAQLDLGMPYSFERGESGPFHGYAAGYCTDLILDAYNWGADYDISFALEQDFRAEPWHFYRWRDSRNAHDMWRYFSYSGQMLPHEADYQPGDIVFFDWSEDGEIDHVAIVSEVSSSNRPKLMYDATGVIDSNPGGLAAELPWKPFHEHTTRGHARWSGQYEPVIANLPGGQYLQAALGSSAADLRLVDGHGHSLSLTEKDFAGGLFFDLTWEQTLSLADPVEGGSRYWVRIDNPGETDSPYQFIVQTLADGLVSDRLEWKGVLASGETRWVPLMITTNEAGKLGLRIVTRQVGGKR
jgi:Tol biopolymer transport system component